MKSRIMISLLGSLMITFLMMGAAHAAPASDLIFQNELQVVPMNETELQVIVPGSQANNTIAATHVAAAAVGTNVQSPAEIAQLAAEMGAAKNPATVSTDTAASEASIEIPEGKDADVGALAAIKAKNETEIPVQLDAKVVEKTSATSLRDMLLVFAVLAGFGVVAYLFISKFKYKTARLRNLR